MPMLLDKMMMFWDGSGIRLTICKQSVPRFRQITTPAPYHSTFTGRMLFLPPNRQRQSTELALLLANKQKTLVSTQEQKWLTDVCYVTKDGRCPVSRTTLDKTRLSRT